MAIYHCTTKPISRSSGRTATASSAYRSACEIKDERTGKTFDYSKKQGVLFSKAFDKDKNEIDRSELWNLAEQTERRKDARTAREYIIAIPYELIPEDQRDIEDFDKNTGAQVAFEFAELLAKKYDVAVDIAIHAPDAEGNNKNYHAHIMTTTRKFERTANGIALTDKSDIELSNKKLFELNKPKNQEQVKEIRALWADTANRHLAEGQRIDHRSNKDRGLDTLPTVKLGWKASAMERSGVETDRGDINRAVAADNDRINELNTELYLDRGRLSARIKAEELKKQQEQEQEQEQERRQEPIEPDERDDHKEPERPLTLLEKRELWKQQQAEQQAQQSADKAPEPTPEPTPPEPAPEPAPQEIRRPPRGMSP